jgi:signal transduction histidine kinase
VDALTNLEEKNEFDEMLHETASDVSKTLSMAVEILANLMTFNKIENGIMTLHKQKINVNQYINNVTHSFAAEARERGNIIFFYTVVIISANVFVIFLCC